MKKIMFFILITVILTSCSRFTNSTIAQPEGKVIVDGKHYTMMPGDYEWNEDGIEISKKSSHDINELAELFETLEVDKGDMLKFEFKKSPSLITVTKVNEDGTKDMVEIKGNEITLPSESGYYIYELISIWPNGKETFVFDVNVE